jgi:uncharacterized protein YndB with AHSA1/START domain
MAVRRVDLASFDDRYTLRYVRVYRAPIERVWRAVTTSDELNIWLYPVSRVEPKLGGRLSFTWGGPERDPQIGEVTVFDPPRRIRFQWRRPGQAAGSFPPGYMEFALESVPEGTRFTFVDRVGSDSRQDQSQVDPKDKSWSLPAGPDTPWRPGFVAGFHLNVDDLAAFLAEASSTEQIQKESERQVGIANSTLRSSYPSEIAFLNDRYGVERTRAWRDLVEIYHDHIESSCPPG